MKLIIIYQAPTWCSPCVFRRVQYNNISNAMEHEYQKAHLNRKRLFRIISNAMIAVFTLILSFDQRNTNNRPQGKSFKMKGEIPFHFFLCFLFEYFCTLGRNSIKLTCWGLGHLFASLFLPFACHLLAIF